MNRPEKPPDMTMKEKGDRMVKTWIDFGLADFARLDIDDHKVLFRFDSCLTPEAMKDLNDPEWAYLSSCYVTDAPEFNYGPQRLRRTQTLHTAPWCDEFPQSQRRSIRWPQWYWVVAHCYRSRCMPTPRRWLHHGGRWAVQRYCRHSLRSDCRPIGSWRYPTHPSSHRTCHCRI